MAHMLDEDQVADFVQAVSHAAETRPATVPRFEGVRGRSRPGLKRFFKAHLSVLPVVRPGHNTVSKLGKKLEEARVRMTGAA